MLKGCHAFSVLGVLDLMHGGGHKESWTNVKKPASIDLAETHPHRLGLGIAWRN